MFADQGNFCSCSIDDCSHTFEQAFIVVLLNNMNSVLCERKKDVAIGLNMLSRSDCEFLKWVIAGRLSDVVALLRWTIEYDCSLILVGGCFLVRWDFK